MVNAPFYLFTWLLVAIQCRAESGCQGDTSTYNSNGLVVPFKNLCGKDIQAKVDFLDPTNENTWPECLARCVEKAPLCYGFDFTPLGSAQYNCWLMNSTFAESSAQAQTYTVDAAMLESDFLAGLSSDCTTLGLLGCFKKNGRLDANTVTSSSSSTDRGSGSSVIHSAMTTSYMSSSLTTGSAGSVITVITTVVSTFGNTAATRTSSSGDEGLSAGAMAGVGAGVGVGALLALFGAGVVLFKRKRRSASAKISTGSLPSYEDFDNNSGLHGRAELQASQRQDIQTPTVAKKDTRFHISEVANEQARQVYELSASPKLGN